MARHETLALLDKLFVVMGVVNVTPDSFFDGGSHPSAESAVDHALKLFSEGADVLDIGGESTRPGALPVDTEEEWRRVGPVIESLAKQTKAVLSIDTTKSEIARRALDSGAHWVNDISAGRFDTGMASFTAQRGCPVILMHSRKTPGTMQQQPHYDDVVAEVEEELLQNVIHFTAAGVLRENIMLDPGIGFAKSAEDNFELLHKLSRLIGLGFPLLVGLSRKSFIGVVTGKSADNRLAGSIAGIVCAFERGARIFRVHDVAESVDALAVAAAVATA